MPPLLSPVYILFLRPKKENCGRILHLFTLFNHPSLSASLLIFVPSIILIFYFFDESIFSTFSFSNIVLLFRFFEMFSKCFPPFPSLFLGPRRPLVEPSMSVPSRPPATIFLLLLLLILSSYLFPPFPSSPPSAPSPLSPHSSPSSPSSSDRIQIQSRGPFRS